MNCPGCGLENREDATFCGDCGAALVPEVRCPGCQRTNPPERRFCDGCGRKLAEADGDGPPTKSGLSQSQRSPRSYTPKHLADKILQSKSAIEGERKRVTVFFADVKGSMELAEELDPEEWHHILDRFFGILTEGVHRFEGTVNQYTGDGIMALFGAPIAHEDHAQRACYAALHLRGELRSYSEELRRSRGLGFSVRMGLNSGEVIVGKIGDDLRMDYTAQGHTVGLAQRMERLAAPNQAYLTEHTAALVEGYMELRDLGPFELKGASDPMRVFELVGLGQVRTRLDRSRARGLSRFVGRTDEMTVLERALERAEQGHAQVVGVVAEAGLGKSRLCAEFLERVRARGLFAGEAHAVAHGRSIPFLPVLDIFRLSFEIDAHEDDRTVRERVAGRLLLADPSATEILPLLFEFLGVAEPGAPRLSADPEMRQRQLLEVLNRMTQTRSQRVAGVILWEDLHWIDAPSDAILAGMVDAIAGTRTLYVVNFRPEYQARWMQKSYYQQISLEPLGPEGMRELVSDLLGSDSTVRALPEMIQARTQGNPFFVEEIVQSLVEEGHLEGTKGAYRLVTPVKELSVPGSVQAILAARIDRLGEREKQVLQRASVIGKTFAGPVLEEIAELPEAELSAALSALQDVELIYEEALYPEAEYAFKHPLTQQVAYESQLSEPRSRVHVAVARAIEARSAQKLDERAALLAHHWEQAGEAMQAANWHHRAAEWVVKTDVAEAMRHWQSVLELLANASDSEEAARLGVAARIGALQVAWRSGIKYEEADRFLEDGLTLARQLGDLRLEAELRLPYAVHRVAVDNHEEGRFTQSRRALEIAEELGDAELDLIARVVHNSSLLVLGRVLDGLASGNAVISHPPEDLRLGSDYWGIHAFGFLLSQRGCFHALAGQIEAGRQDGARALELARADGTLESLLLIHAYGAFVEEMAGDGEAALRHGRAAAEAANRFGAMTDVAFAYVYLGRAHLLCREYKQARQILDEGVEAVAGWVPIEFYAPLVEAQLGVGDVVAARQAADEAVAKTGHSLLQGGLSWIAMGRVRIRTDESPHQVEAALTRAAELLRDGGIRAFEPRIHEVRAELAERAADPVGAVRHFKEAHRLYTGMGAVGHAERLARELGE